MLKASCSVDVNQTLAFTEKVLQKQEIASSRAKKTESSFKNLQSEFQHHQNSLSLLQLTIQGLNSNSELAAARGEVEAAATQTIIEMLSEWLQDLENSHFALSRVTDLHTRTLIGVRLFLLLFYARFSHFHRTWKRQKYCDSEDFMRKEGS